MEGIIIRIYVSGATGLVGSNLVKRLSETGHQVYTLRYDLLFKEDYTLSQLSLTSYLKFNYIDMVIHCAGKVGGIKANSEDSSGFQEANEKMGVNIINAAKRAGVPYFINLASSCAYPINIDLPKKEKDFFKKDAVYEPTNEGYAKAKVVVADYVRQKYGAKGITLIPCNLYGVGDRYFEGSHIIPDLIQKFHKAKEEGQKEVTLYGTGQQYREFMNAADLAYTISEVVRRIERNDFFTSYLMNVRACKEISTMELATNVAATVGWKGTIKWGGELSGVKRKPMSMELAYSNHFFNSSFTRLERGLREQYNDYKRRYINV